MVFRPNQSVPKLKSAIPDSISISEFLFNEKHGRRQIQNSDKPYVDGLSGDELSVQDVIQRTDYIARALKKEFGWKDSNIKEGGEWDRVVGIYAVNTIESPALLWAIQRLNGVASPANAQYSADELAYQLKTSRSSALFTCLPLLKTGLEAAAKAGIPKERVYLIDLPTALIGNAKAPPGFKHLSDFIEAGRKEPELEPLQWEKGRGARQTAFLCFSSGTSGLPKGVMISHRNVIANIVQLASADEPQRLQFSKDAGKPFSDVVLGLLPQSHIYGLVVITHLHFYMGDRIVVLPKFEMQSYLEAIQKQKIVSLYLVPPIIILMAKNHKVCNKFDLSSIRAVFSGAAPLGAETMAEVQSIWPDWIIRQGYGMTESCTVVSTSFYNDIFPGSCGQLLPDVEAKILTADGKEVTEYDTPGELVLKATSVVLGYFENDKATKETFEDGWLRTGDEAVFRKSPQGNEHLFIVDRIKELIKVKGLQVAPAELEAYLLTHEAVADCAVIPIPDDSAGERPKAFIVKKSTVAIEDNEKMLKRDIMRFVEKTKARHKWLKDVEFIDEIPKSPSGKILRRMLRDKEKAKKGAKL